MTTQEFQAFVRSQESWFRGCSPETEETLLLVERQLGVQLPTSIRWLLTEYGYARGTGVSNLSDSVQQTFLARKHLGLNERYVVLENHDDGGLILIDTAAETSPGEHPLYGWVGAEEITPEWIASVSEQLPSFGAYVAYILPSIQKFHRE